MAFLKAPFLSLPWSLALGMLCCVQLLIGCPERILPTAGCESDDECASLERCETGSCIAQALLPDDGGVPRTDAGVPVEDDAGPLDSGSPVIDGGAVDAGISDGGTPKEDSGISNSDAGDNDAGEQSDAGNVSADGGNAVDGGSLLDAGVIEPQLNIPDIGISRRVSGVLSEGDTTYTRATAICAAQTLQTGMHYATHILKNNTDEEKWVTITGNWTTGDGFLFAYDTFDATAPAQGCLVASDDYAGNISNRQDGSRISRLRMQAGEERVLVVTGFFNTFLGEYTLDVFGEHASEDSFAALPERGGFFYSTGTLHSNDALATSYGAACDDVLVGDYFYDEILLHNQNTEAVAFKVDVTVPDEAITAVLLLNSGTCYKVSSIQDGKAFEDFMIPDERLRVRLFSRLPLVRVGNWSARVEVANFGG